MKLCACARECMRVCWCFESESRVIHSLHSGMERHCCHAVFHTHTNTETHSNTQAVVTLRYMES